MAMEFIKRSELVFHAGLQGGKTVTVRANGHLSLSKPIGQCLLPDKPVAVGWDPTSKTIVLQSVGEKLPKGLGKEDVFMPSLNKKQGSMYFSFGTALRQRAKYDYKAAGNVRFAAEGDAAKRTVRFRLVDGTPIPTRGAEEAAAAEFPAA